MSTYYLLFKNDTQYIEIGEISFNNFWAEQGFKILNKIINETPEAIDEMIIKNEQGKEISITEFLDTIENLKIII